VSNKKDTIRLRWFNEVRSNGSYSARLDYRTASFCWHWVTFQGHFVTFQGHFIHGKPQRGQYLEKTQRTSRRSSLRRYKVTPARVFELEVCSRSFEILRSPYCCGLNNLQNNQVQKFQIIRVRSLKIILMRRPISVIVFVSDFSTLFEM